MESHETGLGAVRPLYAGYAAQERLLWRQFQEAASPEAFYASWLAIQCRSVEKVEAGLLLTRSRRTGKFEPAARWPAERRTGSHVRAAAEQVLKKGRALALQLDPQGEGATSVSRTVVARPVEVAGEVEAVVVLDVAPRPEPELEAALRQLAWGCAWIELRAQGGRSGQALSALLEIVSTPLEHEHSKAAATAFVTELATRFHCERVSLGLVERGHAKLLALSHSAQFDKRANLTRMLESAMEEAVDQEAAVVWPQPGAAASQLTQAHEALAREAKAQAICSFLFARASRFCGVVTLERRRGEPFAESELELIDAAVISRVRSSRRSAARIALWPPRPSSRRVRRLRIWSGRGTWRSSSRPVPSRCSWRSSPWPRATSRCGS